MNHCVPDWCLEQDLRSFHDLFPISMPVPDSELMELLWRNGHVVVQSQNNRKPLSSVCDVRQAQKPPESQMKPHVHLSNPGNLIQEDDSASWFQHAIDDSLDKEFYSEFLCEMPITDTTDTDKPDKEVASEGEMNVKCRPTDDANAFTMPPPRTHIGGSGSHANFSHFSRSMKSRSLLVGMGNTLSARTVGSSACGSNHMPDQANLGSNAATGSLGQRMKDVCSMNSPREPVPASTFDATMTSSLGGSGSSFGRTTGRRSTSNQNHHKRKGRDGEESESHSEEAEYESVDANGSSRRAFSSRKSRASEVHNLSERKRRDRINEKMKALQELIPHCNKSDKASMLEEAIEYLKSLQLQLQLMWMGSGMAPMMFPGVQQYMSRVGIGMGHASINNPIQLSRAPLVNHSMPAAPSANQMPMCPSPTASPNNFPAQMQDSHMSEPYARYFGFPQMQLHPQAMNFYAYGSHMVQQNQTGGVAGSSSLPTAGTPLGSILNGQPGK